MLEPRVVKAIPRQLAFGILDIPASLQSAIDKKLQRILKLADRGIPVIPFSSSLLRSEIVGAFFLGPHHSHQRVQTGSHIPPEDAPAALREYNEGIDEPHGLPGQHYLEGLASAGNDVLHAGSLGNDWQRRDCDDAAPGALDAPGRKRRLEREHTPCPEHQEDGGNRLGRRVVRLQRLGGVIGRRVFSGLHGAPAA